VQLKYHPFTLHHLSTMNKITHQALSSCIFKAATKKRPNGAVTVSVIAATTIASLI
jgi:hypothetical protein